ncbi:hypothetical protein V8E53_009835 [Lactarius tabidus]
MKMYDGNGIDSIEEFVAGTRGLYESEAFTTLNGKVHLVIWAACPILAALGGPANSQVPLSWSIVGLAQRAISSNLPKPLRQKRIQTCLRALQYIHDLLASYAVGIPHFLEILPLLNSPESLEVIDEMWDTPNCDVALSVQCTAAAVAS